jgi:hypothetical protein
MIAKSMRLLEKITGAMLEGVAVSVQIGNFLICVFMLLLGPAFIIRLLIH